MSPPKYEYWHEEVLSYCAHVETPRSWIWWSLITAVSAVSANYSLRTLKGAVLYRPNLYVMLLGESGLGKGFGVNLSKLLVSAADCTRVIAGRSSIQAIVSELAKAKTNANGKAPILDSRGFVINGELSSAIIADVDALSIFTDLYDGHYNPEWDNLLKVSGREKLKRPYIVTLFGSSPDHFYDSIPAANIGGGYVARNLIVFEEKRFQNVDLLDGSDESNTNDLLNEIIIPKFAPHLEAISSGKGSIKYSQNAGNKFNTWRRTWRENQQKERTGFFNRVPDHVLKTAMCICLSRYDTDLMINESEIEVSIEKVSSLIYANKTIASNSNENNTDITTKISKVVLNLLIQADENKLKKKNLMSRAYPFGLSDSAQLDKVLDFLLQIGWIKKERIGIGTNTDWLISLDGEPLNGLIEHKRQTEKMNLENRDLA